MAVDLYTVGHSDHPIEDFIDLVAGNGVGIVGDVRSNPYSRYNPQFNREPLIRSLDRRAISYVFLGSELGGRGFAAEGSDAFPGYDRIASTERFVRGLDRLRGIMVTGTTALMCAERDPVFCHRMLLVCRALRSPGIRILHILEDGTVEEHADAERRLLETAGVPPTDLFDTPENIMERAYDLQWRRLSENAGHTNESNTPDEPEPRPG